MNAETRTFADKMLRLMAAPAVSHERVSVLFHEGLPGITQECPQCRALHVSPDNPIPLTDPAYLPVTYADDGYCSQECEDDAAQAAFEARYGSSAA